jgi:hypothetical protein
VTYNDVYNALSHLNIPCTKVAWSSPPKGNYLVTRIGGQERDLWSDNRMTEQELWCTVDLFVRGSEGEDLAYRIQHELNGLGIRWELTSIQWEEETMINHWEWTFYVKGLL